MRKRIIITVVVLALLGGAGFGGWRVYQHFVERYTPQACTVKVSEGVTTRLSAEQARNASIIATSASQRGLPERAAVVALATAYQESGLRNIDYGDRDSVGLFQQRPSQGWGSVTEIMDPWYAAGKFYDALERLTNWEAMSVTDAAQAVQISAFPEAYAKHEVNATAVAAALLGSTTETMWCLSFDRNPAIDVGAFADVLEALGDSVAVGEVREGRMEVTGSDRESLWAAVNNIVANSYAAGVTEVTVENRRWSAPEAGWAEARDPAAELTAVVTFG